MPGPTVHPRLCHCPKQVTILRDLQLRKDVESGTGGGGALIQFQLLCRGAMEFIVALSRHFGDLGSNLAVLQDYAEVIHGSFVIRVTELADSEIRLEGDEAQGKNQQTEGAPRWGRWRADDSGKGGLRHRRQKPFAYQNR